MKGGFCIRESLGGDICKLGSVLRGGGEENSIQAVCVKQGNEGDVGADGDRECRLRASNDMWD